MGKVVRWSGKGSEVELGKGICQVFVGISLSKEVYVEGRQDGHRAVCRA